MVGKPLDMNPTIPHLMPAFGWHISGWNYLSSIGNRMESEKMFPMKHWKTLNNLIDSMTEKELFFKMMQGRAEKNAAKASKK